MFMISGLPWYRTKIANSRILFQSVTCISITHGILFIYPCRRPERFDKITGFTQLIHAQVGICLNMQQIHWTLDLLRFMHMVRVCVCDLPYCGIGQLHLYFWVLLRWQWNNHRPNASIYPYSLSVTSMAFLPYAFLATRHIRITDK